MTPNEKELLGYFKDLGEANAVTMSKKMALSIDYTQTICERLEEKRYLEKVSEARYPVYCLPQKEEKEEEEEGKEYSEERR